METLGGFPYLPAFGLRRAKPVFAIATDMESLGGLPYLPAFGLRRAKPVFASATSRVNGDSRGSCCQAAMRPEVGETAT